MPKGLKGFQKGKKDFPMSENIKNRISLSHIGKHHSKDTKLKIGNSNRGKIVDEITRTKISIGKKGKPLNLSLAQKLQISLRQSGPKNHNWKGGLTILDDTIRHLYKYRQWRSDVFTRDEFTCQGEGLNHGTKLNAHHLIPLSCLISKYHILTSEDAIACDKLWDINNGVTLCEECHKQTDSYGINK